MNALAAREAALRIVAAVPRQPTLRLPLDDALGAVLAEDVVSPLDLPAWTNSAMDGYAARGEDVRGATDARPVQLRVVEQIPAGQFPTRTIAPGECARIFTGAPLPAGADSVIRQEDTDLGRERVAIRNDRDAGVNIRLAGEDIRKGATVLEAGAELGAAELGVLASMAVAHPLVFRRPLVGILGGGDEIVDVDQPEAILSGRKIASSNSHSLHALVRLAGGVPLALGIARDTPESVRAHLARAPECDLLVTSAGISVGEHDHLRAAVAGLGGAIDFWKLRMRPGAPVGFGQVLGIPWIGLPGNPVSAMVTFELFVRPAIRAMAGHGLPFRRTVPVRTAEAITLRPTLQHFLRAIITETSTGPEARLTGPQGSGILTSMVRANALLVMAEGRHETAVGERVPALLLQDPVHQAEPGF
ncbi:MAG TPA: molybdopterin molybdotransferase MoeA [Gemmatimonadales bacterium]|nr:molybdopterin molybdotransferase MoeA [Gemmatimonadales bacterium]